MNDLLDHPLIQKYFGTDIQDRSWEREAISERILRAMQRPIKKGERFIRIEGETQELVAGDNSLDHQGHWGMLRLPDQFQKQDMKDCDGQLKCDKCGIAPGFTCRMPIETKPDPVEEKINEVLKLYDVARGGLVERKLHELVELARKQ